MKNLILTLAVAGAAVVALASTADAGNRGMGNDAAWRQTLYSVRDAKVAPAPAPGVLVEGRNLAVQSPAALGVEPYIARQIEQDRRGNR